MAKEKCFVSRTTKTELGEEILKTYRHFLDKEYKVDKVCLKDLILEMSEALYQGDKDTLVQVVYDLLHQACIAQASIEGNHILKNSKLLYFNMEDKTVTELVDNLKIELDEENYVEVINTLEDILYQIDFDVVDILKRKRGGND